MKQFKVTGMSCASCSVRVERAVRALKGVTDCSVSLLTNSMGVDGPAAEDEIIAAVEQAGYHAEAVPTTSGAAALLNDERTPALRRRLISSIFVLLVLMYVSMGYVMWGWPFPEFLQARPISVACIEFVLSAIVIIINQQFFTSGFKSVLNKAPNMDTLVSLGSGASFLYSLAVLLIMMGEQESGYYELVEAHLHSLYFDSAAMILTLITVGKLLESVSKGRTTSAIKDLIHLQPNDICVVRNGHEETISVTEAKVGDIFIVKSGDNVPLDGVIIEGSGTVNEAAITGESLPRDVMVGDTVRSATLTCTGYYKCRATRVGEDTTLSQIIRLVSDAASSKAPISKTADKVSAIFVPVVLAIAFITLIVWLLIGRNVGFSVARAVSVLVISCPCALGLATPVAIMVGSGKGARNGILFKTALTLEQTGRTNVLAMDKTGTITKGEPVVTDVATCISENEFLQIVYNMEKRSEHPLARAICHYIEDKYDTSHVVRNDMDVSDFRIIPGKGMCAFINNTSEVIIGNMKHMLANNVEGLNGEVGENIEGLSSCGKTPVIISIKGKYCGVIGIADVIKDDCIRTISELHKLGVKVIMLTGDNKKVADHVGHLSGVDQVVSEILPQEKEEIVRTIKRLNDNITVAMAGDGINDAPALTRADIGIAVGNGTDIAIESANIVLMKNDIRDIPASIRLSRKVLMNIKENLFWAFVYNIICIPLAAGVYTSLFGWELNPMVAAAAMSLSSFCVVMNALRLNLVNIYDDSKDKALRKFNVSIDIISGISDLRTEAAEEEQNIKEPINEIEEIILQSEKNEEINTSDKQSISNYMGMDHCDIQNNKFKKDKGQTMKKIMKIEGMMCEHCEARVKKILESIPNVKEAVVNHVEGTAIIEMTEEVDDDVLRKVITDADYKVTDLLII